MLRRRLQVLIDDTRWNHLADEARQRKVSVGTVVREAIDSRYRDDPSVRTAAFDAILAADAAPVPPVDALVEELRALRGRHER